MAPGLEGAREDGQGARPTGNEGKTPHLTEKLYNVTFVYDDQDLPWVKCAVNYLEENYDHSVYYRGRDATAGNPRTANSTDSIKNSDVIVVAISKDFINNGWGEKERGWAVCLSAKKNNNCKLLPVLLDGSELPDELSHLDPLRLTSVEESQEKQLEQVAKSVCKLLPDGQMSLGANVSFEFSGFGENSKKPTGNGSVLHHHNGTLVSSEGTATTEDERYSSRQPQDNQLMNKGLKHLLYLLVCKFVVIFINVLDFGNARIPECLNAVKENLQQVAMFLTMTIQSFFTGIIQSLQDLYEGLGKMLLLQILYKKLKSIVAVFQKEVIGTIRFSGDGSFPTFAGTWIYNASVFSVFGLVLNGLVWRLSGYNILQASIFSFIPLISPLLKGFYCMKHMPKYRETIRDMYSCKTLKRKSMKDKMVKANVEYREVRSCLFMAFLCDLSIFAIGCYVMISVQVSVTDLATVGNLIPVVILVLHTIFLLSVIIRYYHDQTVCTLITRRRFLFPDIMEKKGFDQQEKHLLSMIDSLNKTERQKKMARS